MSTPVEEIITLLELSKGAITFSEARSMSSGERANYINSYTKRLEQQKELAAKHRVYRDETGDTSLTDKPLADGSSESKPQIDTGVNPDGATHKTESARQIDSNPSQSGNKPQHNNNGNAGNNIKPTGEAGNNKSQAGPNTSQREGS